MNAVKTSQTHPLRIDEVEVGAGRLGLTFCPGKKQPDALTGSWSRDLAADLDVVRGWGASIVITLLEDHELKSLDVEDLGAEVERRGIEWHQLPIQDAGIPRQAEHARWFLAALRAQQVLTKGGRVLLHCKGGLGRTGMMGARLLVENGAVPRDATAAVRAARQGAIETSEQEQEVLETRPHPKAWARTADRVLGSLLGGAVGDGLGYAVEFLSLGEIRETYESAGITEPLYTDGQLEVSDDTQMTLFTVEALLRSHARVLEGGSADLAMVALSAYRRWLRTQGGTATGDTSADGWLVGCEPLRH